jgi:hypothetical protein
LVHHVTGRVYKFNIMESPRLGPLNKFKIYWCRFGGLFIDLKGVQTYKMLYVRHAHILCMYISVENCV